MPRLETPRLLLRAWRPAEDVAAYKEMLDDPEVMRHIGVGWRYAVKRAAAALLGVVSDVEARRAIAHLIRHWRTRGYGEWAVVEKASGALIGQIGLVHHADWLADPTQIEVGWMLARRAWGKGLATEGARATLRYAFDALGIERVVSITRPENQRSLRVMQRLGLEPVGSAEWKGGTVLWYAIDRATYHEQLAASS